VKEYAKSNDKKDEDLAENTAILLELQNINNRIKAFLEKQANGEKVDDMIEKLLPKIKGAT